MAETKAPVVRQSERPKRTGHRLRAWYPPALRWWNLLFTTVSCWVFIGVLQYLLHKSQTEGGVIFAADINSLPLSRSFVYLYLPTVIAVLFSIFIVWIDHDAKRFEPYRLMSRSHGARGDESLLLRYPFDFVPMVPFTAAKRGHWLVFWASLSTVLMTFGVVPFQAGIFSTKPITRTSSQIFARSEQFMHSSRQESSLTLAYTQSAYGILELNETLPAFMSQNYTLKPFSPKTALVNGDGTWTANTTMYSLNLQCQQGEKATDYTKETPLYGFNSSFGCFVPYLQTSNITVGEPLSQANGPALVKQFSAQFLGYYVEPETFLGSDSNSVVNLRDRCSDQGNGTFFATFGRNKAKASDPPTNFTTIFCKPTYHEQAVEATVDARTNAPIEYVAQGEERQLPSELFNTSVFEETLVLGQRQALIRDNVLPGYTIPKYLEQVPDTDLTTGFRSQLPPMAAMAMMASKNRLPELLDPQALADAYLLVYQLLFARAMTDVLKTDFSAATSEVVGQRVERLEAVVLEPVFTYLVEAFLGLVSVAAIVMLGIGYLHSTRKHLVDDPGSIAAVMSLVADDAPLLANFEDLDCAPVKYFQRKIGKTQYRLGDSAENHAVHTVLTGQQQSLLTTHEPDEGHLQALKKPHQPVQFRLITALPFTSLFIALMIVLAILYAKSQLHGLPLPSTSRTVQNLMIEYLPTAIATLIEPVWILLNRLLCALQPLEELRKAQAPASRSIALGYGSLPPQLSIVKAARNGHFLLTIVCAMALLANLLAVSFAGLFIRDVVPITQSVQFTPPYLPQFVQVNGSVGPPIDRNLEPQMVHSGAYRGGTGEDHFLLSESNYTRNTSLPSWTDDYAAYVPFRASEAADIQNQTFQARTKFFTVEPNCKPLRFGEDYRVHFGSTVEETRHVPARINVLDDGGKTTQCYTPGAAGFGFVLGADRLQMQFQNSCRTGRLAAELITTLEAHTNDTESAKAICRSATTVAWARSSMYNCTKGTPEPLPQANEHTIALMSCQPKIHVGDATVRVDEAGVLQEPATDVQLDPDQSYTALSKYFTNGPEEVIQHSNLFIFRTLQSSWHNDTFASEYLHYFMNRAAGHQRLTDPSLPLPSLSDVREPLNKAYGRLFAIWLGVNQNLLLQPASADAPQTSGLIITPEERLFFVKPLFIISEAILAIYILASIFIYLRRPGRHLARVPTSIAAVIALFASSAAVKDMQGTSHMTNRERERHLADLDARYGYGSYVGGDGSVHVGIEKAPYVVQMEQRGFEGTRGDKEIRRSRGGGREKDKSNVEYTVLERADDEVGRPAETLQVVSLDREDEERQGIAYRSGQQ
ncbi:hypothetical protein SVAN01_10953 [Stagonosporopsis vannaccii]|nr:hypothetical protein SVAN01_10953 [Stagonosporopsis vannaccii]